jgi:hypothetical protein
VIEVNDALEKCAPTDPEKTELVKLRYLVGFTLEEAASALHMGNDERTKKKRRQG